MTRKYPDRQRRIPLDGRPVNPDWHPLLYYGIRAVDKGLAEESPYLSAVIFRGINERGVFARAAAFDYELLLEWLSINESDASAYIRDQLGTGRAPSDGEEAREMLARPDCLAERLGTHRLRDAMAVHHEDDAEWAVGWCLDCMQALLWRFPAGESSELPTWPFYDHRVSATVARPMA
jgi:hypothetical protein